MGAGAEGARAAAAGGAPPRRCGGLLLALALLAHVVLGDARRVLTSTALGGSTRAALAPGSGGAGAVTVIVVGDWGRQGAEQPPGARRNQTRVAAGMDRVAAAVAASGGGARVAAVVSVGDNFYGNGLANCDDPAFNHSFSAVYDGASLRGLAWDVLLGNHDYRGDISAQLDDCAHEWDGRWRASGRALGGRAVYASPDGSVEVHVVFVDTNPLISEYAFCPGRHVYDFDHPEVGGPTFGAPAYAAEYAAFRQRKLAEVGALLQEAAAARDAAAGAGAAAWLLAMGHHPVRSNSHHGPSVDLLNDLDALLWRSGVDAWVAGHEHDLQHMVRPHCCAFEVDNVNGQSLEDLRNGGWGEGVRCDPSAAPPVKYPNADQAPFRAEPGAEGMHYVVTGAGSQTRQSKHPADQLPQSDSFGSFYHPGPGFVSVEAHGAELSFVYRDAEAGVLHTRTITKK